MMNKYKIINASECCIVYQDQVCLMERSKVASHYPSYYCFPGGSVDENEDPLIAAKREVLEETGINLENEHLELSVIQFNYHDDDMELWMIYTFKVRLSSMPTTISTHEGNVSFVNIGKASELKLVPQTKDYFLHTQKNTHDILLINQHFIDDKVTSITTTTQI